MTRLLIVDDDSVDLERASRLLSGLDGLEIAHSAGGHCGVEAIEAHSPDLVLSDIRAPELAGLELVRECKQRFPELPVILMASRGSEAIAVEALKCGAASYVAKADFEDFLVEAVEGALAIAEARRQHRDVMAYLELSTARFKLGNEPELIPALVAHLQDDLERCGFGDVTVRSHIGTALMEALSNAMIHGNLEVGSKLRDEGSEPYHALIAERRETAPWSERQVHCSITLDRAGVRFAIRDEGPGFDVASLPDPTEPESMLKARGRGLFLIHAFMDQVEHNDLGNEIRLFKSSD